VTEDQTQAAIVEQQLNVVIEDEQKSQASRWLAWVSLIGVSALSVWIALNPGLIAQLGSWGYLGAFLISLAASASVILPIPGLPIAMAMGYTLNPWLLGLVTGVASAIGELSGYAVGASGRILITGDQAPHFARIERWTRKYGALTIFVLAATPFPFFDLAGIVAGAIRMPLWAFFVATAAGKTIKYTIAILIGAESMHELQRWSQ
jgi:membrane protein DedA with SNARE-associated domain